MNTPSRFRHRFAVLIGSLGFIMVGALPLIGQAQDATPSGTPNESQIIEEGAAIYNNVCIACHQPDGNGIEGIYLPLNGNALVTLEDPTVLITTLLNGRGGMPRFDTTYDDAQIAAITTYVRQEWDNDAAPVSEEQVAGIRASITEPEASPTPEGQIPSGEDQGSPVASPEATP